MRPAVKLQYFVIDAIHPPDDVLRNDLLRRALGKHMRPRQQRHPIGIHRRKIQVVQYRQYSDAAGKTGRLLRWRYGAPLPPLLHRVTILLLNRS